MFLNRVLYFPNLSSSPIVSSLIILSKLSFYSQFYLELVPQKAIPSIFLHISFFSIKQMFNKSTNKRYSTRQKDL